MALAPVSISKLKQFRDKTSRSLSYRFSPEFGLRWHLVSEWIRERKRSRTHRTSSPSHDGAVLLQVLLKWDFVAAARIRARATEPPLEIHKRRYRSMHNGGVVWVVLCCNTLFTTEWGWNPHFTQRTPSAPDYHWLCSKSVIHIRFYIATSCGGDQQGRGFSAAARWSEALLNRLFVPWGAIKLKIQRGRR